MLLIDGPARTLIENWGDLLRDMAQRLRLELMRSGGDETLRALLDDVRAILPAADEAGDPAPRPFVPVLLNVGGRRLSLLSVLAEFGTPRDITISDLRIELFFAGDARTEHFFAEASL
jgi:hypothetical protein